MMPRWFWGVGVAVLCVGVLASFGVPWVVAWRAKSECVDRGHAYFQRNPGPTSGPAATSADSLHAYIVSACDINPQNY